MTNLTGPVVVGIDGSAAALHAMQWAVQEALARDVALRLVHVVEGPTPHTSPHQHFDLETQYGQTALRAAEAALTDTYTPVKIDTALIYGPVDTVLVDESLDAAMICLGSVGVDKLASTVLGSTALTLATQAHCPVAIIRDQDQHDLARTDGWIVAVIDRQPDSHVVLGHALDIARRRKARVLALGVWSAELGETAYDELDRQLRDCQQSYPDVHARAVAVPASAPPYLENWDEPVALVVMGSAEADLVPRLLGPRHPSGLRYANCSVLVIRD
ncbi:universal stress protein [Mycolicibacterium sp.]|uniref:universal stress protein n=1 Tax=Mycolicibacterium sp. TaxID=2320850 RepID=UPI0037C77279